MLLFYTGEVLEIFCPKKQIFSRPNESPFITEDMKILKRLIMREYEKHGKTAKYLDLKIRFKSKMDTQILKYKEKIFDDIKNGNRKSTYSALRKLGVRPGDQSANTFSLPSHVERNLTPSQSAEIMADHFSSISKDYEPISIDNFNPRMRNELLNPDMSVVPTLEEYEVYRKSVKLRSQIQVSQAISLRRLFRSSVVSYPHQALSSITLFSGHFSI